MINSDTEVIMTMTRMMTRMMMRMMTMMMMVMKLKSGDSVLPRDLNSAPLQGHVIVSAA